jgi:hypothetical protein
MNKPNKVFFAVGIIGLLWNAMGSFQFIHQVLNTETFRNQYTNEQLQLLDNAPFWVIIAFGFAVFFGLFGCIALLLKKSIAYPLFLLSLLGIICQMFYNWVLVDSFAIYDASAFIMTSIILIFALFLAFYSKLCIKKQWIH